MNISWLDVILVTILIIVGLVLLARSIMLLAQRDAEEVRRNLQSACLLHKWVRRRAGLVCALCGKVPG